MARAPSRTAASADGVTQAAANSGWWLTAPPASMPISGWMVGHGQRHVGHVGRDGGRGAPLVVGVEAPPERLGVGPVGVEQGRVGLHVRVDRSQIASSSSVAPGGQGARPRSTRSTRGSQDGEPLERSSSRHMNRPRDRLGDDVGRAAAVGHDAVDLVPGAELLAQEAERHLGDGHGVAGVDPLPRRGRGVGLSPVKVHVEVGDGQAGAVEPVGRPGVDHHRRVDVVEGTPSRA